MVFKKKVYLLLNMILLVGLIVGCDDDKDKNKDAGYDGGDTAMVYPSDTGVPTVSTGSDTMVATQPGSDTTVPVATDTTPGGSVVTDSEIDAGIDAGSPDIDAGTDTEVQDGLFPIIWTFDNDLEDFTTVVGTGVDAATVFTHNATSGTADLTVDFAVENELVDFVLDYGDGVDWRGATSVDVVFQTTQYTTGGIQIYIKTGADWDWCGQWVNHSTDGSTITGTLDLASCSPDLTAVRQIGIQVHSGGDATGPQTVMMSIDSITVNGINLVETELPTDTGSDTAIETPTDTEQIEVATDTEEQDGLFPIVWTFNTGLGDFFTGVGSSVVDQATAFAHNPTTGTADVSVEFSGPNETVDLAMNFGDGADWTGAETVEVVFQTTQYTTGGVQAFVKTGPDWNWCGQWTNHSSDGSVITATLDLSTCGTLYIDVVRQVGLQVHSGGDATGAQTVIVSVDSIRVDGVNIFPTDTAVPTDTVGVATDTAVPTDTVGVVATDTAVSTDTVEMATDTAEPTDTVGVATDTAAVPTDTEAAPATDTAVPTDTVGVTTDTAVQPTDTGEPTDTMVPTDTSGPTDTMIPTDTSGPSPTDTSGPTDTMLPTDTSGPTDTMLPTDTSGPTDTMIPTDTGSTPIATDTV